MGAIYFVFLLSGIVSGIIGCFGFKKHGARTTLTPGLAGAALSITIITVILLIAVPSFNRYREASNNKRYAIIQKMADQANAQLPKMIDDQTRFDEIVVIDSNNLKYKYTFIAHEKDDIDIENFVREMKPNLIDSYNTGEQFKILRENHIAILYEYYDKAGVLVASIKAVNEVQTSNK
jgi:competence protein ComGC